VTHEAQGGKVCLVWSYCNPEDRDPAMRGRHRFDGALIADSAM